MRKLIIYSLLVLCVISCWYVNPDRYRCTYHSSENERFRFEQRLNSAEIRTYLDKDYNIEVSYPAFFAVCDTSEDGTARFYYPNEHRRKISLVMFVEPNIEGWNIHEAIEHLADSLNICKEETEDYYLMEGGISNDSRAQFYEKCYLIDDMWINYTLYYPVEDKSAIGRLFDLVKEWSPRPSMKNESTIEYNLKSI